ncbi:hypothetical protein ACHHYP_11800 [Achlya hypogyna]|uniref:Protein-tyrosine sulfotransferase n=1 Tax=Achlya hypogyna TaxID=1202772 RepID=A0A1V9YIA6_ACHHY|nr:hypothetical protein ACHHYP_11800 [Achlya hypogyna]
MWEILEQIAREFGIQEAYMLLNVICLGMFLYYLIRVAMGHPLPEPKKPDPTLLHSYWFSHWWLNLVLATAWVSHRFFCVTLFPFPKEKLLELVKGTPKEAEEYFGDQTPTVHVYETLIEDLDKSPFLSAFGRFHAQKQLLDSLRSRIAFMEYIVAHPELTQVEIPAPIIITGLPRTGSTLLHNLLACDPAARAPYHYELDPGAYYGVAPPTKALDTEHVWFQRSVYSWDTRFRLTPEHFAELTACQVNTPETIAEDTVLAEHVLPPLKYAAIVGKRARRMLITAPNKRNVYMYMRRYYQLLQSGQPDTTGHWVLKAPMHSTSLDLLRETFPGARIVVLHRDMKQVVPSSATHLLREVHPSLRGKALDKKLIAKIAIEVCSERTDALLAAGQKSLDTVDLHFDEWIAEPIATVKKLYEQWGMDVSPEFEAKMVEYLEKNPKGKYGEIKYTTEEYGLSNAALDCTFGKYAALQARTREHPELTSPRHDDEVHAPTTA